MNSSSRGGRHRAPGNTDNDRRLVAAGIGLLAVCIVAVVIGVGWLGDVVGSGKAATTEEMATTTEPLALEEQSTIIRNHLDRVPLPFPRSAEIHGIVAAAAPTSETEIVEVVDEQLRDWNLTPEGTLVHNACPPHARACVDVDNRLAWLQEDGRISHGPVPVTTGEPGHETPRGEFRVLRKIRDEISYVYDNEPMPYTVYFTNTGVAFHQGPLDQDSHGCLHLSHVEAVHFFDVLHEGDIVATF